MTNHFEPRPANAHEARDAGLRPLVELHDFEVSDDDPDVRGWTVRGSRGTDIGVVRDLLIDVAARRARYLDVELFGVGEDSDTPSGRHVLIPIGAARLDDDSDIVRLPMATATNIRNLPNYQRMRFDRAFELSLLGGLNSMAGLGAGGRPRWRQQRISTAATTSTSRPSMALGAGWAWTAARGAASGARGGLSNA